MTLKGSYKIQVASKSSFTFHLHYSFFRDLYHVTLHRNVFFFQCIILKYVLYMRACVCISFLKSHVCLYVRVYVLLNISKYLVSHYGNHVLLETRICTCWIFVIEQSSRNSWEWHLLFSIYTDVEGITLHVTKINVLHFTRTYINQLRLTKIPFTTFYIHKLFAGFDSIRLRFASTLAENRSCW